MRRTQVFAPALRESLYGNLVARQNADGGFGTSAYETALAVALFGGSRANLALDQSSVRFSNTHPAPGETITVFLTVRNFGDASAENVLVQLYGCDDNAALDGLIAEATIARIDALSSAEVSFPYLASPTAGIFNLCIVIDGNGAIPELSERDNGTSIEINVSDAAPPVISGLQVDYEYISPNGDGVQDAATLAYRISENATVSLSVKSEEGFIEAVANGIAQGSGANTLVWGGQGAEAPRLADGRYTLILSARDLVGNTARASIQVTIDNNQLLYRYTNRVREIVRQFGTVFDHLDTTPDGRYLTSQSYYSPMPAFVHDFDERTIREIPRNANESGLPVGILPHRQALVRIWAEGASPMRSRGLRVLDIESLDEVSKFAREDDGWYWQAVASADERTLYTIRRVDVPEYVLQAEFPIDAIDTETGEVKTLFSFVTATGLPLGDIFISKDGQRLYAVGITPGSPTMLYEYDLRREELHVVEIFDASASVSLTPTSSQTYLPVYLRRHIGNYLFFTTVEGSGPAAIYQFHAYDLSKHRLIELATKAAVGDVVNFSKVSYVPQDSAQGIYFAEIETLSSPQPPYVAFRDNLFRYDTTTSAREIVAENLPEGSLYIDPRNERALLSTKAAYGLWTVDLSSGELSQAVSYLDLMPNSYLWNYGAIHVATPDGKRIYFGSPSTFPAASDLWRIEFSVDPESQERFVRLEDVRRPLEDRRQACFSGLAMDSNFESWRLEYLSLDHPLDGWRVLTSSSSEASSGQLGCFDTTGLPSGLLVFRLVVTDLAGNVMEYGGGSSDLIEYYQQYGTVPENFPGTTFLFYNNSIPSVFAALPSARHFYLSPNGDGSLDSLQLNYGLKGLARISAWITDASGTTVADLVSGSILDVGSYAIAWDGATSAGLPAADGEYVLHLRDDYVADKPETVTFRVTIDTVAPTIALADPADRATVAGIVALTGNVNDANLKAYSIKVRPQGEAGWRTLLASATAAGAGVLAQWDTTELGGEQDLVIAAVDLAANSTSASYRFSVDNTPPAVALLAPSNGSIVYGPVRISATSTETDLASVRLSVKLEGTGNWTQLAQVVTAPFETVWDTAADSFPHGTYLVRAIAVDRAGNSSAPSQVTVLLDKQEPSSSIAAPVPESVVRGMIAVRIETQDADIVDVGCFIRPALESAYTRVGVDASAPYVVGLSTTAYPDGIYYLASQARDVSGLVEAVLRPVPISIDNTLPAVSLTSPSSGQAVGGSVAIAGSFADQHPHSYTLSWKGPLPSNSMREFASGNAAASGVLGTLETASLVNGDYLIVLAGRDQAGNSAVVERSIRVANMRPEILAYSLDNGFVSPNGDGVKDDVGLSYTISSGAVVTLEARNSAGSIVAVVLDRAFREPGTHQERWYPRGVGGQVLADGTYTLHLAAADEFGNESTGSQPVEIDTTVPLVTIGAPTSGSQHYGLVGILGAVTEKNFAGYRVLATQELPGASTRQLFAASAAPVGGTFTTWDSTGLVGSYTVEVEATDKAGNKGSATASVTLVDPAPAITVLPLVRRYQAAGPVALSVSASRPGILSITVVDDGNRTVKSVAVNRSIEAGIAESQWDLTDSLGQPVSDGQYGFTVAFVDGITRLTSRHQSEAVIIDTHAPGISITSPLNGATLSASTTIQGVIEEPNFGSYALSYGVGSSPASWVPLVSSTERPATAGLYYWDITSLSGLYTVKLEGTDLAGNYASPRTITVNAAPLGTAVIANPALSELAISPNGDEVKDQTSLGFSLLQDSRLTVWIENGNGVTVASLLADVAETAGPKNLPWGAKDAAGVALPDGTYSWFVKVVLPGGQEHIHAAGQCIVDTTAPVLNVASPLADATVIDTVEVRGDVVESNFGVLQVSVHAAGGAGLTPLASFQNRPASGLWARWDTGGLSGDFQLVFAATDRAGNSAARTIPVTVVDGRIPFLSGVSGSTPIVSPNGDGYLDSLNAKFTLSRQMSVEVAVRNSSATQIRLLQAASSRPGGDYSIAWDGRNGSGAIVAEGQYTVVITASDPLSGRSEVAEVAAVVDGNPPTIVVESPAPGSVVGQTLTVSGSVTETRLRSVSVSVDSGSGYAPIGPVIMTGNRFSAATALGVSEGQVGVKIAAQDEGGLLTERVLTVSLDALPPVVSLGFGAQALAVAPASAPARDAERKKARRRTRRSATHASLGASGQGLLAAVPEPTFVKGVVAINYSAVDLHLKEAVVQFGLGSYWYELCRITASTPNATCNWDASYRGGEYKIRLGALDWAGNSAELIMPVIVDNYPPQVSLYEPTTSSVISENLRVSGSVYDNHLERYLVEYRRSVAGDPWKLLREGQGTYFSGEMAKLTLMEPFDGQMEVHLFAVDRAGSTKEQFVKFAMDNIKPPAPTGVAAVIGPAGRPILTWDPVIIGDLKEYRVYRDSSYQYTATTAAEFTDDTAGDGRHRYTVSAVDLHDNVGPQSVIAEVIVDRTPPSVQISSPTQVRPYGGVIEISGSAYADDLAWYRIEVGVGASPLNWKEVRFSTLPRRNEALAYWPSFPAQGTYSVRLTAEDLRHNPASTSVSFSVDNEPPAPPSGARAQVVDGSTIRLLWTPNSESDLAGYRILLYGNAVQPELVTTNEYSAANMPDGAYRYSVAAVDQAGNVSQPSPMEVMDLDNRAPAVIVVRPANGALIRDQSVPLTVVARSVDYDVILVEFQYRSVANQGWTSIGTVVTEIYGTSGEPITLGDIGMRWSVSGLAEGDYLLRAVGTDRHAQIDPNPSTTLVHVRKLPAPPIGLVAGVEGHHVTLGWTPSPEPDVTGYRVYRDGQMIGAVATAAFDEMLPADALHRYAVSAADAQGDESDPSVEVTVRIDTAAPLLAISAPVQGARIAGLTTVSGTVSESSLASFKLEYSLDGGATWTDILALGQGAPPSFSIGWQTSGLNGAALLRASAQDQDGNRGLSPMIALMLDNVPPAVPDGVMAVANDDGTVSVSWNAVSDQSFVGYLVFGQREDGQDLGQLSAAVVGGTTFDVVSGLDPGRVICFTVSAVDDVGNMSARAVPACVTPGYRKEPITPWICSPLDGTKTGDAQIDIHGYAPPYSKVLLLRNDQIIDSQVVPSTSVARAETIPREGAGVLRRSPDGRWIVYRSTQYFRDYLRNERLYLPLSSSQFQDFTYDSASGIFTDGYSLKRFDLATKVLTEIVRFSGGRKLVKLWASPASRWLACLVQTGVSYEIQLVDSRSGAGSTAATGLTTMPQLAWHYDGSYFLFTKGADLVRYHLDSGVLAVRPFGQPLDELWSGRGEEEVFYRSGGALRYRRLTDGSSALLNISSLMGSAYVPWAPGFLIARLDGAGYVFEFVPFGEGRFGPPLDVGSAGSYSNYSYGGGIGVAGKGEGWHFVCESAQCSYRFFSLPGRFTFSGANLVGDVTYFAAADENASGARSPLSSPVTVVRESTVPVEPPGISVGNLFHEPANPLLGDAITVHARVNCGIAFFRNVTVTAWVRDGAGVEQIIWQKNFPYFSWSDTQNFVFSWMPSSAGTHQYFVEVTLTDNFASDLPEDNLASGAVQVRLTNIAGSLTIGQNSYVPGDTATATASFFNPGTGGDEVGYSLSMENLEGITVVTIAEGVLQLGPGQQQQLPFSWAVPELAPGLYRLRLTASAAGSALPEEVEFIEVRSNGDLNTALFVENANLRCGEAARLLARVGNSSTNAIFEGIMLSLQMTDPAGGEVSRMERTLASLYPYSTSAETFDFAPGSCVPGRYLATLNVSFAGQLRGSRSVSFTVSEPSPVLDLTGTLSLAPRKIARGMDLTMSYEIRNNSRVAAVGHPARIDILDPLSGLPTAGYDLILNCAPGDVATGQVTFPNVQNPEGFYPVLLTTTIDGAVRLIDQGGFEVGDVEAPRVTILEPQAGSAHPRSRLLAISARVTDNLSGVGMTEFRVAGRTEWMPLSVQSGNSADATYSGSVDVSLWTDGEYVVEVRASDRDGNNAYLSADDPNPAQASFTLINLATIEKSVAVAPRVLVYMEPEGQSGGNSQGVGYAYYERALAGIWHTLVGNMTEFTREMASGSYNIFVVNGSFAEDVSLTATAEELAMLSALRERANAGAGVLFSRWVRFSAGGEAPLFAELTGNTGFSHNPTPNLPITGPASGYGYLQGMATSGKSITFTPLRSSLIASLLDDHAGRVHPTVAIAPYGRGSCVYVGFNLAKSDNNRPDPPIRRLVRDLMSAITPAVESVHPGSTVPVRLAVDAFSDVELRVEEEVPPDVVILDAGGASPVGSGLEWRFPLSAGGRIGLTYLVRLPEDGASLDLTSALSYAEGGAFRLIARYPLTIDYGFFLPEEVWEIGSLIQALGLPSKTDAEAAALVAELAANPLAIHAERQRAVADALTLVNLIKDYPGTESTRLRLDRLLFFYQRQAFLHWGE